MPPKIPPHELLTATAVLRTGERITMRPLRPDDAARLGSYFGRLSAETRSLYGPHAFDQATADQICATLDPSQMLRMVATISLNGEEAIIAYMLLYIGIHEADGKRYAERDTPLDPATDAALAPSVADDYQNQGVGSAMLSHVLRVAGRLGRKRLVLWGGVQSRNERAIGFYTKWGFRKVGEFYTNQNNHDMILDLSTQA